MNEPLTPEERETLAAALEGYAAGVQENLEDDHMRPDGDEENDADYTANEAGMFPVVEDYLNDAQRIRMGETPLHELTWEVLRDETGPTVFADDEPAFRALVARLLGDA